MPNSEEYDTFKAFLTKLLAVPHSEITRREEEYRKRAAVQVVKRGPKPKVKKAGKV